MPPRWAGPRDTTRRAGHRRCHPRIALLALLAGCGRIGFEPLRVNAGATSDGPGSSASDDGPGGTSEGGAGSGDTDDAAPGDGNGDGDGGSGVLADGGAPSTGVPDDAFVIDLSLGRDHACAVTRDGSVLCWGAGSGYRLGTGKTDDEPTPVLVPLAARVAHVSCGDSHTLVLTEDGEVYGWGENSFAELGDGSQTDRPTPVLVTGLGSNVAALDSGGDHACVRLADDSISCWGYNLQKQVGVKTGRQHSTPVALGRNADELSAGGLHTCARLGGTLQCWGAGAYGQLGNDGTLDTEGPADVLDLTNVTQVSAGRRHTCAVTNGSVFCWGDDEEGQLGDGTSGTSVFRARPTQVPGVANATRVSAGGTDNPGGEHSCVLHADATVSCWGGGSYGQLGDGDTLDRTAPVVTQIDRVLQIEAGGEHSCALRDDGSVWCWGRGDRGRLGDGSATTSSAPVRVAVLGP